MRPHAFVLTIVASLLVASPANASRETTERAAWSIVDVARDGRSLVVGYNGGGCRHEATARVLESTSGIWIRLDQAVSVPEGENEACTLDLRYYTLRIRLRAPVAGREIHGHAHGRRARGAVPAYRRTVPRVTGLAPSDARHLLRAQRLRVNVAKAATCAARAQVVGQTPRAHRQRRSALVHLLVREACRPT
jgi:hypothetical protein